ncbi:MAG: hypothetical protein SGILL_009657, partial [Bacillariaceae sp.]
KNEGFQGHDNRRSSDSTFASNNKKSVNEQSKATDQSIHKSSTVQQSPIRQPAPSLHHNDNPQPHRFAPLPVQKVYQPYWNLTCPLELSMFSGIHMNQDDYVHRAWAARELAERAVTYFGIKDWSSMENRRILFIGDSLLRQVFISLACMAWDHVQDYSIPWFTKRQVRTRQPNTIGSGPHSKFEEGRVLLKGNIELIYHHGMGGLLELGEEYQTHETETWIKACYLGKPFTALAPKYLDWATMDTSNFEKTDPRLSITSEKTERERLTFTSDDIVLINASVHGSRSFNLKNIVDLFECKKMHKVDQKPALKKHWPNFYYILTGPSHFPTKTGAFDKKLLEAEEEFGCIDTSTYNDPQVEETAKLKEYLPLVGTDISQLQMESGYLHVGGRDCLHWMQPGMPDLLAADVMRYISARL